MVASPLLSTSTRSAGSETAASVAEAAVTGDARAALRRPLRTLLPGKVVLRRHNGAVRFGRDATTRRGHGCCATTLPSVARRMDLQNVPLWPQVPASRPGPFSRLPSPQKCSRLVAAVAGNSRHVAGKSRACGGLLLCFSRHSGARRSFLRRKKRIVGGCLSIYVRRSGGDVHNAPSVAEQPKSAECSTESMMWQP